MAAIATFCRFSRYNLKTIRNLNYSICNYLSNSSRTANMSGEKMSPSQKAAAGVPLQKVVKELTDYAPLALAESWDNVGLLIEPYTARDVTSIMLTNDLTKPVMDECLEKNIDMIISYHPPIFVGKKRITNSNWKDQLISCCLENRIAVYSPHTTWDSVPGGLSDWLASAFGDRSEFESVNVLEPYSSFASPADHEFSLVVRVQFQSENYSKDYCKIRDDLTDLGIAITPGTEKDLQEWYEYRGTCSKRVLSNVRSYLSTHSSPNGRVRHFEIYNRIPLPEPGTGGGRLLKLKKPMPIETAIDKMKSHLGVRHARIAYAVGANSNSLISSIALVPGSGAKPLSGVRADLYVTGEMLHHDVLAATHNNTSVLMTTHSDSERGFLTHFAQLLLTRLNQHGPVNVTVSAMDRDPIEVV